ncbi:LOW QUALITY PROTEIN: tRNA pseudouridine synthase-like 1 [Eudromia elegans]
MVSPKTRYLVFFQYFGSKYSISILILPAACWPIVGYVLCFHVKAAQNLKPSFPIKFHISSRTDAGVHALCNSAHLDVQRAPGKRPFHERELVCSLNHHLKPEPIRAWKGNKIPNWLTVSPPTKPFVAVLWEHVIKAVWVTGRQSWDSSRLSNFSTFCSLNSETPLRSPVRTILQADIRPSAGLLSHHYEYRGLEFWELQFRSRSFLYRQVRRMAGAHVAVGQGKLSPRHVKELLEKKNSRAFPPYAVAPPSGLFLKSVAYNEAGHSPRMKASSPHLFWSSETAKGKRRTT